MQITPSYTDLTEETHSLRKKLETRLSNPPKSSDLSPQLHERLRGNTLCALKLEEQLAEVHSRLKKRKRSEDESTESAKAIAVQADRIRDWCDSEGM